MMSSAPPFDVTLLFPELAGAQRHAVRLHPHLGTAPGIADSKMGGLFAWPVDEPWPQCHIDEELPSTTAVSRLLSLQPGELAVMRPVTIGADLHNDNLVGVVQLRRHDVPELDFYPGTDLFQLLWCPRSHAEEYAPYCRAFWRSSEALGELRREAPAPRHADQELVPTMCAVSPERVIEFPHPWELPDELQERIYAWEDSAAARGYRYADHLSVAPGTKVGGYVRWSQSPPGPDCTSCGGEMQHLITIASDSPDAPDDRWNPAGSLMREQTNIVIGDAAQLTVFVCRLCPNWPITWVHQA